jgi:hypothetical protein
MSDLQLEKSNNAEEATFLFATPHDLGPDRLEDFVGSFILQVVPDNSLRDNNGAGSNNFGGIVGQGVGTGVGLRGISSGGPGVQGQSENGNGVLGEGRFGVVGNGSGRDSAGVQGNHSDIGAGVWGQGSPGVNGVCSASPRRGQEVVSRIFAGVAGSSLRGPGVYGTGIIGGQFEGNNAQLCLVPASGIGKPNFGQHNMGELYMDSTASLFICVAGGSPGTWVKVVTA